MKTILQVPIDKSIRDSATAAVRLQGFSSLQEAIRVFLTSLSKTPHRVLFEPNTIQLSQKAVKRYDNITKDVYAEKNISKGFINIDDMMNYLNS